VVLTSEEGTVMQIEDFKRWHWIVISLVIGGALAYARTMVSPDDSNYGRGIAAGEFASSIDRPPTGNGYAWITDVTVYPPQIAPNGDSKEGRLAYYVTCKQLTILPSGKGQYKP